MTGFFLGTGLSNRVFAKEQVGSNVFLFRYIRLVTGNQAGGIVRSLKLPILAMGHLSEIGFFLSYTLQ